MPDDQLGTFSQLAHRHEMRDDCQTGTSKVWIPTRDLGELAAGSEAAGRTSACPARSDRPAFECHRMLCGGQAETANFEVGFKIGFNKRPPSRIHRSLRLLAQRRINSLQFDAEFRNQQVAGSIPAGGSSLQSRIYKLGDVDF